MATTVQFDSLFDMLDAQIIASATLVELVIEDHGKPSPPHRGLHPVAFDDELCPLKSSNSPCTTTAFLSPTCCMAAFPF